MKTIAPILIGVALVAATVFALLRHSSPSWVPVEEGASGPGNAKSEGESDRGFDGGSDEGRERGARSGSIPGRQASAGGPARADRPGGAGPGSKSDPSMHPVGKGSAAVVAGQGSRAGGVLGEAVGARARDGGSGSGASIADQKVELPSGAREHRTDVSDFLGQPPPGGPHTTGDDAADDVPGEDGESEDGEVLSVPLSRDKGTVAEDSTAPVAEQDLVFADDGEGVKFDPNSVLAYPNAGNLKGDAGTMMLDIEPDWNGGDEGDFSLVNVRNANDPRNLLRLFKNGKYLRFIFADESGEEREASFDMSDWESGERHSVAVTWGDAATALYVDSQLIGQNTYNGVLSIAPGTPMYLGSDVPEAGAKGAGGTISNFRAFGRALNPGEIASPPPPLTK